MSLTRCPEGHLFSSRRYGNICPYCNQAVVLPKDNSTEVRNGDVNEATAYIGDLEVLDPVVGWIVCTEGPSKGKDYKLYTGKNFLGRSDGMDIQVLGDNYISKKNHAIFVYDPKKKETLVLAGDSHGLVYVNGESIYTPVILSIYDEIEVGKSKFLFIPFCGEHFEWKDLDEAKDE
jgi:hypothetical protein